MTEPGIADEWAARVPKDHLHRLVDVENMLLINNDRNVRRLEPRLEGAGWRIAWLTVFALLAVSPLAAPVVFSSGSFRGTSREYDAGWAYPTAAAVCWIGLVVVGIWLVEWRRRRPVRHRDPNAAKLAVVYVISTGFALSAAHGRAETVDGSIGWYVVPMWILLPASLATAVYQYRSPADPAWPNSPLKAAKTRVDVRRIHPDDQAWLLEERDRALRVLADRGMLEGGSPDELANRPLGQLHLPQR